MIADKIINKAINKAKKSSCRYRVAAIGLNNKNEPIGITSNTPRFEHFGGSLHAEMALMKKSNKALKSIVILRTNAKGKLMPIHACKACQSTADSLGIKIINLFDYITDETLKSKYFTTEKK